MSYRDPADREPGHRRARALWRAVAPPVWPGSQPAHRRQPGARRPARPEPRTGAGRGRCVVVSSWGHLGGGPRAEPRAKFGDPAGQLLVAVARECQRTLVVGERIRGAIEIKIEQHPEIAMHARTIGFGLQRFSVATRRLVEAAKRPVDEPELGTRRRILRIRLRCGIKCRLRFGPLALA